MPTTKVLTRNDLGSTNAGVISGHNFEVSRGGWGVVGWLALEIRASPLWLIALRLHTLLPWWPHATKVSLLRLLIVIETSWRYMWLCSPPCQAWMKSYEKWWGWWSHICFSGFSFAAMVFVQIYVYVFSPFWICISVVFEQCFVGSWPCRENWPLDQGAAYFPINAARIMCTMCTLRALCTLCTYFPVALLLVHLNLNKIRLFGCVVSLAQHFVRMVHIPLSRRVPLPQYKIAQSQYLEHCLRIFYTENWSVDQRRAYFASAITAYFVGCPACDRCAYKQT